MELRIDDVLRSINTFGTQLVKLATRHGTLNLSGLPVVMGVLNVTPDSFSDGGRFFAADAASGRATEMVQEGAVLIDVGAESSRPEAQPVDAEEQIRRAVPVIEAIRAEHPDVVISADTTSAAVAGAALRAGADIINDISALRSDPEMAPLVADAGAGVVLMHMRGTPVTMQRDPRYDDVVREVKDFLGERIGFAVSTGIARSQIIIDPGIGFGKTIEHNCALLHRLDELVALGPPVLLGASRKSVVRGFVGTEHSAMLAGSLMCALAACVAGAKIIRAHDVYQTVSLLETVRAAPSIGSAVMEH